MYTYKNLIVYGFIHVLYVCAIEGMKEIILDSGEVDITCWKGHVNIFLASPCLKRR